MTELPNRKPYSLVAISPGPSYVIAAACESTIHFFDTNLKLIGSKSYVAYQNPPSLHPFDNSNAHSPTLPFPWCQF